MPEDPQLPTSPPEPPASVVRQEPEVTKRKLATPRASKSANPASASGVTNRDLVWHRLIEFGQKLSLYVLIGFIFFAISYWGIYKPVEASAGQATTIKVIQDWAGSVNAPVWLGWLLAGVSWAILWCMRREHKNEREDWHGRNAILEKQLDANRTSSDIDQYGERRKGGTP